MDNMDLIKALVKTQKEIESVTKDRSNPIAHSTYATLDAILEEVLPKLNANGIFLTQNPVSKKDEEGKVFLGVETTLFHETGQSMSYPAFYMQIEENARMNMAQAAGSIITYGKRYAISAILGISTDEDKDGVQPQSFTHEKEPEKELTTEEAMKYKLTFGKHKGKTLEELATEDKSYMRWLLENAQQDSLKDSVRKVGKELKRREENAMPDGEQTAPWDEPTDESH